MSRREHLAEVGRRTRFRKGQSGNPGGKPKGWVSITAVICKELARPVVDGSNVTRAQMIAEKVVALAMGGHPRFVELVWAYMDGRPGEALRLEILDLARQEALARGLDPDNVVRLFEAARARRAGSDGRPGP